MQKYRNHKLVVRYDPAICISRGVRTRSATILQSIEQAVVNGNGAAMPSGCPQLRTAREILTDALSEAGKSDVGRLFALAEKNMFSFLRNIEISFY